MKINNETKVGILAIVSILILVLGFNFLKGKKLFSKQPVLFAIFKNIGSLERSNQVKINGLPVGTVSDFNPTDKEVTSVLVEIHLNRDLNIPDNSIAFIDGSLVGSAFINIDKGTSNSFLKSGDTVSTRLDAGLFGDLKTQLAPTITRVNETVDSLKYVLGKVNSIFDPRTNNNIQAMISNLTVSSADLQRLMNAETGIIAQTMGNLNTVASNLAKNNDQISQSIRNVEITTGNLANARIQETVAALEGTINELKNSISRLDRNINNNNGTLGKLMNDRKLYDQLNQVALSMEILLDDVRVHPKRYVNISVFGGKTKNEALNSPVIKDTIAIVTGKK